MASYSLPRAILWDWDNTLADSWGNIHAALNETFVYMGHAPQTLEDTKTNMHLALEESFPKLFNERWTEAREHYRSAFSRIHLDNLAPLPGAEETLTYIKNLGVYSAVVSNKRGDFLRREASHLQWDAHFSCLYGALDVPAAKPAPDLAYKALENSGFSPKDGVWLIGDSLTDLRCAHASGCVPVLFGDAAYIDPSDIAKCPPAYHVADHAALRELLRNAA